SRRRHTRWPRDWSSDVCSSDLRFVADFIGASTVLEARALEARAVEIAGGLRIDVRLPRPLVPGEHVRLLIRPERVELGEGADTRSEERRVGKESGERRARDVCE